MSERGEPGRTETFLYDADGNRTEDESLAVRGEVVELDAAVAEADLAVASREARRVDEELRLLRAPHGDRLSARLEDEVALPRAGGEGDG